MRGDVIQLLGFDGVVDKTYDYDAYGNEYARDLGDENPFRYCGEYYDTETGFIYLRARYYDPMVGRFTSVDPIKDGLNWYSYCAANPVLYADKNGLFFDIVFDLVSLGFSVYDVITNPDDVWAWLGLAGDVADLLLVGAGGIGEVIKFADKGADAVKAVSKLVDAKDYKKAGAWLLGAFERGYELERKLGGMCNNFPTIDKFVEAISTGSQKILSSITSIKSMDVTAKTYQNASKMYSTLKKYIDDLYKFTETTYKNIDYLVDDDAKRILELALPPVNLSSDQAKMLEKAIEYAKEKGIEILIQIIE